MAWIPPPPPPPPQSVQGRLHGAGAVVMLNMLKKGYDITGRACTLGAGPKVLALHCQTSTAWQTGSDIFFWRCFWAEKITTPSQNSYKS